MLLAVIRYDALCVFTNPKPACWYANGARPAEDAASFLPLLIPLWRLQGTGTSKLDPEDFFVTTTEPLDVWLDVNNFRYSLHAVQRGYEWRETQVVGYDNIDVHGLFC